jgi:hypothetical protein
MEPTTSVKAALQAFTYKEDIAPTLYIEGDISTNGEKPQVSLREKEPQGPVRQNLLLEMQPDVYDPSGKQKLTIKKFEKKLQSLSDYETVKIIGQKGDINLKVEQRNR